MFTKEEVWGRLMNSSLIGSLESLRLVCGTDIVPYRWNSDHCRPFLGEWKNTFDDAVVVTVTLENSST